MARNSSKASRPGRRSPLSIACMSSTTRALRGVSTLYSLPLWTTPPLMTSTSVFAPLSRSWSIEALVGPLAIFGAAYDEGISGDAEYLVHCDPLGCTDVVALAPDGKRCLSPCRVGDDLAVEQTGDGAEAGEGAVDEQLGPHLAADVLRDTHFGHRFEYFGEEVGPFLRAAFGFPDHERRPRGLRQMAGSKVRSPPLHRPDDEVLVSDDRGYAVLHEPVA